MLDGSMAGSSRQAGWILNYPLKEFYLHKFFRMKIGNIDLGDKPVLLAPMEDVTDASFRGICREQGADMVYTEFIPAEGLVRDARKAYAKLLTSDEEAPVGIQIYGSDPDAMVRAAGSGRIFRRLSQPEYLRAGGYSCFW